MNKLIRVSDAWDYYHFNEVESWQIIVKDVKFGNTFLARKIRDDETGETTIEASLNNYGNPIEVCWDDNSKIKSLIVFERSTITTPLKVMLVSLFFS